MSRSRTEPHRRVERARMLLWYADGATIAEIMRRLNTNRPKVERCVDKALSLGAVAALDDLPGRALIRVILDNHSAHVSKETRAYLANVPNRFEFVFTPKHGSWLNLVESFFGKLARTLLRGIHVDSIDELKERILQHLDWLNADPVVFKWGHGMDDLEAA